MFSSGNSLLNILFLLFSLLIINSFGMYHFIVLIMNDIPHINTKFLEKYCNVEIKKIIDGQ